MESISELCRVCSGRGDFDIFAPIPIYVHENVFEHKQWKQNISKMIFDISGLSIKKNDCLPQKICEICISYLKHAVVFRQQYLNNTVSILKAIELLSSESKDKDPERPKDQPTKNGIVRENGDLLSSVINNQIAVIPNALSCDDEIQITDKFFKRQNSDFTINLVNNLKEHLEKKNQTNQYKEMNKQLRDFIRQTPEYDEVPFEEDDIMSDFKLDDGSSMPVSTRLFQERCKYCKRRYMFQETFEKHLNECIVKSLTNFIWEINYCLRLKDEKQISSNQFVQRMISGVKNGMQIIEDYHRGVGGLPHAISTTNSHNDDTITLEDKFKLPESYKNEVFKCDNNDDKYSDQELPDTPLSFLSKDPPPQLTSTPNMKINSSINLIELFANEDGLVDCSQTFSAFACENSVDTVVAQNKRRPNRSKKLSTSSSVSVEPSPRLLSRQISESSATNASFKQIACRICGETFNTIQHLDQHKIKNNHL